MAMLAAVAALTTRGIATAAGPEPAAGLSIGLRTDQGSYQVGDLITLSVNVSRTCHLTLIQVDPDGQAIVLFPNELEPDNQIAPGLWVAVPGRESGYQFRLDRVGVESFVAVCQRHRRYPNGIRPNYERQRFTILGDWAKFQAASAARGKERSTSRRSRSRSRRNAEPVAIEPGGPAIEARAETAVNVVQRESGTAQ